MDFATSQQAFLQAIAQDDHMFSTTLEFVEQWYDFTPTAFKNGPVANTATENQGSAKVLALGEDLGLDSLQVLQCFGEHYRDVLATPGVENHFNLRRLVKDGFCDVSFEQFPLKRK